MLEPLTLSALGAVALTEGIKFLYAQAGDVLKRWRERKEAAQGTAPHPLPAESVDVRLPSVFEGQLIAPQIHFEAVQRLDAQLREAWQELSPYAAGIDTVDPTNENLQRRIDVLRRLLEAIYQQRLTFQGEHRPPSGPVVKGRIDVDEVAGYAAAVRARVIASGQVTGEATSKRVAPEGRLVTIDVDTIGGTPS